MSELEQQLDELISPLQEGFSGYVSLALHRFEDDFYYGLNADKRQLAASLIKLPILIEALAHVEGGQLRLESRFELNSDDLVGGSGVLKTLEPGLKLTLHDLLTLMIIVSDNTATNLVLEQVSQEAVNHRCAALGMTQTELVGKLQLPVAKQNEVQRGGKRNTTSPQDVLELLIQLTRGELLGAKMTEVAISILKKQQLTEALARYLPTDPDLSENFVTIASKSGCLRGCWHDAGVMFDKHNNPLYALVVMTVDAADQRFGPEQEGMMLIAKASKRIFDLLQDSLNSPC